MNFLIFVRTTTGYSFEGFYAVNCVASLRSFMRDVNNLLRCSEISFVAVRLTEKEPSYDN